MFPVTAFRRFPRLLPIILWAVASGGSPSGAQEASGLPPDSPEAREYLRREVAALRRHIIERMRETMRASEAGPASRKTRREVRKWGEFVIQETEEILEGKEPLAGLFDLWALTVQMDDYVGTGAGHERFGVEQVSVQEAMSDIREEARSIASDSIDAELFESVRSSVLDFAIDHPLDYGSSLWSRFFDLKDVPFSVVEAGESAVRSVASVPLLPKRAGEGIRRGTEGIRDFNVTAERFTDVVEALPRRTREELEALLTSLEDQASTLSLLTGDLQKISAQVDSGLKTVESMSPDVRETVRAAGETGRTLGDTAREFEAAATEVRGLIEILERLTDKLASNDGGTSPAEPGEGFSPEAYADTAAAIESGAAEVRLMLAEINRMLEPDEKAQVSGRNDGRPFDITEYAEAARAIESGSVQVRGILADLKAPAETGETESTSEDLLNRAVEANDRISERLEALIDHVLLRAGMFLFFVLLLLLAYRVALSRFLAHSSPGK